MIYGLLLKVVIKKRKKKNNVLLIFAHIKHIFKDLFNIDNSESSIQKYQ